MSDDLLLWLDLETTGVDETRDCVLEVGAVLTTPSLDELGHFTMLVRPTAEGLGRLMLNDDVRRMHEDSGLLREILGRCHNGPDEAPNRPHQVARWLITWAETHGAKPNDLILAGSGVSHFDRRFITRWMGELDKFLRYWCIDIGVIRRAHRMWVGTEVSTANEDKTHRALDDARCHLAEAKAYAALWAVDARLSALEGVTGKPAWLPPAEVEA